MRKVYQVVIESCDLDDPNDPGNQDGQIGKTEVLGRFGPDGNPDELLTKFRKQVNRILNLQDRPASNIKGRPIRRLRVIEVSPEGRRLGATFNDGDIIPSTQFCREMQITPAGLCNALRSMRVKGTDPRCMTYKGVTFADLLYCDPDNL